MVSAVPKGPPPRPKKPATLTINGTSTVMRAESATGPTEPGEEVTRTDHLSDSIASKGAGIDHVAYQNKETQTSFEPIQLSGTESKQAMGQKSSTLDESSSGVSEQVGGDADRHQEKTVDETEPIALTGVGRTATKADGKQYQVDEAEWASERMEPEQKFAINRYRVDGKHTLSIESTFLQELLNKFLKRADSPHVTKEDGAITLKAPFMPLYFYYESMLRSVSEMDSVPESSLKDVESMKYYYEKYIASSHTHIRETANKGWVSYEDLWALFQPGELLYSVDGFRQGQLSMVSAAVFRNASAVGDEFAEFLPMPFMQMLRGEDRFVVDSWCMEWESSLQVFKRQSTTKPILRFSGSRPVTDLAFYPVRFYANGDQHAIDEILNRLEERGRFWQKLVGTSPSYWYHDGPATEMRRQTNNSGFTSTEEKENRYLSERVVVDHSGYKQFGENAILSKVNDMMASMFDSKKKIPERPVLMGALDEVEGALDDWPASKPFSQIQARLCPSELYSCAPRSTIWYYVSVANLKPIEWGKDAIDSLVIEPTTKDILRGLVEEHKKRKLDSIVSDFMPDKGQGLVIVLHGPPGVGKTLTAECIAEFTEKPLYSINIGDLSSDQNVVQRLEIIFELSARWDALLLLDEADVVLEKRSFENIHRNAVVSVFLRMLEYYRGMVFLTTNRLGTMDIAFQSRVSLAIKFNLFNDDARRQIWLNFIKRLDDVDREGKMQLLECLDDIKLWQLNGRQIRNVLRMAQVIVISKEKRPGALSFKHVEQMALETLNFQHYFQEEYREPRSQLGDIDLRFREKRIGGRPSNSGYIAAAGQWE
ncbi:AAA family ATPase [Seiridium cupressi]